MTAVRTNVTPNQTWWTSGAYTFDGTGNIKTIGGESYLYDSLSRVVNAQLPGASQLYSYDPYGNITSTNTNLNEARNER